MSIFGSFHAKWDSFAFSSNVFGLKSCGRVCIDQYTACAVSLCLYPRPIIMAISALRMAVLEADGTLKRCDCDCYTNSN